MAFKYALFLPNTCHHWIIRGSKKQVLLDTLSSTHTHLWESNLRSLDLEYQACYPNHLTKCRYYAKYAVCIRTLLITNFTHYVAFNRCCHNSQLIGHDVCTLHCWQCHITVNQTACYKVLNVHLAYCSGFEICGSGFVSHFRHYLIN